MDPYKITKKLTKKFGSEVINRQYFHRKTGLYCACQLEQALHLKIVFFSTLPSQVDYFGKVGRTF